MDFITNYPKLCRGCNKLIATLATMLQEGGPDTDDPEAPLMYAYDHALLCGGRDCKATCQDIEYSSEITGAYCGQINGTIYALDDNTIIGKLDWSKFGGSIQIDWIEVDTPYQRQGIATGLYQTLRQKTDDPIMWGLVTAPGARLKEALEDRGVA